MPHPLPALSALATILMLAACSNPETKEAPVDGDIVNKRAADAADASEIKTGAEIQEGVMNSVVRAVYLCANGDRLTVDFDNPRAMATVRNSNGLAIDLHQQKSASGLWYTAGGYELRGKGNEATWTASDRPQTTCRAIS